MPDDPQKPSHYPAINKAGHLVTLAAEPGATLTPELVEDATGLPDAFDRVRDHLAELHFTDEGQFTPLAATYARLARGESRYPQQPQQEAAPPIAATTAAETGQPAEDEGQFVRYTDPRYHLNERPYTAPQIDAPPAPTLTPADRAAFAAKAAALDANTRITPAETGKLIAVYNELADKAAADRAELDARYALAQASPTPDPKGQPPMIVESLVMAAAMPEATEEIVQSVGEIAAETVGAFAPTQAPDPIAAIQAELDAGQEQEQELSL